MIGKFINVYLITMEEMSRIEKAVNEMYDTEDYEDVYHVNFMDDLLCEQEYGTDCYVNLAIDADALDDAEFYTTSFLNGESIGCEYDVRRYRLLKYLRENVPQNVEHLLVEVCY